MIQSEGGACTVQGRRDCRLENPPAFIQRSEHEGTSGPELADVRLSGLFEYNTKLV
jgi:hypothetical protein